MSALQLVVIVFGLALAFGTYRAYRRRDLLAPEAGLWLAVWLGLIIVTAFPEYLRNIVQPLHVARLLDLVVTVAILFLSGLVFLLNSRVRRLERRSTELVRRLALSAEDTYRNREEAVGEIHRDPGNTTD